MVKLDPTGQRMTVRPRGKSWNTLVANVRARGEPCCRCGQRIDQSIPYPDPDCFSVDHYPYPLATHPWLATDPANLHAAHLVCNQTARDTRPQPGLGSTSEAW